MIEFSFQVEPHLVLEVPRDASLGEIRDAYRRQAKRYHPDAGGADWAFRVLAQAYEVLSLARLEHALRRDAEAESPSSAQPRANAARTRGEDDATVAEELRLQVAIERLWVHYDSEPVWLRQDSRPDDQSLSCSLNFKWPDPSIETMPLETEEVERILSRLAGVFEEMCVGTNVDTSRIRVNDDSFTGWLSYATQARAAAALQLLQDALDGQGFNVRHWDRELVVPRVWQ